MARIFSLCREYNTEDEEMKHQQRMAIMKDLIKKIRSKERMDAKNRWWYSELLAADCEKACIHTGMKKKDEREKMEEMHQRKVEKMIPQNHKANDVEERSTDLGERGGRREIAGSLRSKKKRKVKILAM